MTARTGLGPVEVALLDSLDLLGGSERALTRCSDVLAAVERLHGVGPRYSWPVLVDLAVPWRLHLPLVDAHGNVGSQGGFGPADAQYVEARLSDVGALALAAERGEVGPVPLGLVEGSLYRGGPVPPFAPDAVVGTLLAAGSDAGPPVLPTGGEVSGDLAGLLAGRPVRLTLGCTIRPVGGDLVITEVPLGVEADRVVENIGNRSRERTSHRGGELLRPAGCPVVGAFDESTSRTGLLIRVQLDPGADLRAAVQWLRDVWPVTVAVDCRLPAPQAERLSAWERGDGSGLRALADLLAPHFRDDSSLE